MKIHKKIASFVLCFILCATSVSLSWAEESALDEDKANTQSGEINQDIDLGKAGLTAGNNLFAGNGKSSNENVLSAFSDKYGLNFKGMDSSLFNSASGLSGMIDMSNINSQYAGILTQMMSGSNENLLLKQPEGGSLNCTKLFNETYGDIAENIGITKYEIPEEFNPTDMMANANKIVSDEYSKVLGSDTFKTVKSKVSIGKVMAEASGNLSMPGLVSLGSLDKSISGFVNSAKKQTYSRYSAGKTAANKEYQKFRYMAIGDSQKTGAMQKGVENMSNLKETMQGLSEQAYENKQLQSAVAHYGYVVGESGWKEKTIEAAKAAGDNCLVQTLEGKADYVYLGLENGTPSYYSKSSKTEVNLKGITKAPVSKISVFDTFAVGGRNAKTSNKIKKDKEKERRKQQRKKAIKAGKKHGK